MRIFLIAMLIALLSSKSYAADDILINDILEDPVPVYRFGVQPWQYGQTEDDIRARFKPMLQWLGDEVGARFIIVSARDYNQTIELMANEVIDIGSISPAAFVLAERINPNVEMLLTKLSWDIEGKNKAPHYDALIVARRDRDDIDSIASLEGKKFGYISNQSTSGYVYPQLFFQNRGIDPEEYFSRLYYLGSHPRLTDAIAAGSLDAGATWDYNLRQAIEKHGPIFKIIKTAATMPNVGIGANSSMPDDMKEAITSALLEVDSEILDGLPTSGFVRANDSDYDAVRDALSRITSGQRPDYE